MKHMSITSLQQLFVVVLLILIPQQKQIQTLRHQFEHTIYISESKTDFNDF